MAENKVQITIEAANNAKGALNDLQNDLKGVGREGEKLPGIFSSMKSSFLAFTAASAAMAGIIATIKSFVNEAAEAEEIENRLRYALENLGYSWDKAKNSVDKFADSVADSTRYSDDEARRALTDMLLYTRDFAKAQDASRLAMDMSVRTGQDLSSSIRLIGMALSGNTEMLGRHIYELRDLDAVLGENATNAQKAEYALRILGEKFGGTAQEDLGTYSATVKQFDKAWKDFSETIGMKLLPPLKEFFDWITKAVKKMDELASGKAFQGKGLTGDLASVERQIGLYEKYISEAEKSKPGSYMRLGPEAMADAKAKLDQLKTQRDQIKENISWIEKEEETAGKMESLPDIPVSEKAGKGKADEELEKYFESLKIALDAEQGLLDEAARMEVEARKKRWEETAKIDKENQEGMLEGIKARAEETQALYDAAARAEVEAADKRLKEEEDEEKESLKRRNDEWIESEKSRYQTLKEIQEKHEAEMTESWDLMAGVLKSSFDMRFVDPFKMSFKDIGAAFTDMLRNMVQAFMRAINQMAVNAVLFGNVQGNTKTGGGLFGIFKNLFGSSSGTSAPWYSSWEVASVFHEGSHGAIQMVPRLHSGLAADEFPAILQTGEQVLSRREVASGLISQPYVVINVENKTGNKVRSREGRTAFDGKRYVKSVVLELVDEDMAFRNAIGVMR